jgi:hypothetical protein
MQPTSADRLLVLVIPQFNLKALRYDATVQPAEGRRLFVLPATA